MVVLPRLDDLQDAAQLVDVFSHGRVARLLDP